MTLLENAKKVPTHQHMNPPSKDQEEKMELALAWIKEEITGKQVCLALGYKNGSSHLYNMAIALKRAYREGLIEIK